MTHTPTDCPSPTLTPSPSDSEPSATPTSSDSEQPSPTATVTPSASASLPSHTAPHPGGGCSSTASPPRITYTVCTTPATSASRPFGPPPPHHSPVAFPPGKPIAAVPHHSAAPFTRAVTPSTSAHSQPAVQLAYTGVSARAGVDVAVALILAGAALSISAGRLIEGWQRRH